jgi:hypothetical protein
MTQKDKELLMKDLCARLPYGVKYMDLWNPDELPTTLCDINVDIELIMNTDGFSLEIEKCKPYLLPLSSMTEEQKREYNYWKHEVPVCRYEYGDVVEEIELYDSPESFEYLMENHFDYRGLIEKGLALDATGLNIY